MNITKLLVVVFIAALCDNVGATQLRGMPNDTKLMDQELVLGDIVNIVENITTTIIRNLPKIPTRPINTTIPTLPNSTSPAPSPESGLVEIAPSPAPQGEATNGTEAPLSGGAIGFPPSLLPIGGSTEPPLSGGVIGVSPPPESGAAPATDDIAVSIIVNSGETRVSTEGGTVFTTNNFGSEDGSNGGSGTKP